MNPDPSPFQARVQVERFRAGIRATEADAVAREEPLEIRIRGESVAVTMRTPGHDQELAAGFLFSEGLIHRAADIVEMAECANAAADSRQNILNVFLSPAARFDPKRLTRHVFASSSCGVCGKATIEAVQQQFPPVATPSPGLPAEVLVRLPQALRAAQDTFERTGGLHAAALFQLDGALIAAREDVGRHNAVDKTIGFALLNGLLPLSESILVVSSRASFEILQKALAASIPIVAALSAPSSLAIQFARESNQTLIGFLRGESFNIYSHPERVR